MRSRKSQCLHPGTSVLPAILRRRLHQRSKRLRRPSRKIRQARKMVVRTTTSPGMTGDSSRLHRRNRQRRKMRRRKLVKARRRSSRPLSEVRHHQSCRLRGTIASLTRPRCCWTHSSNARRSQRHHSCLLKMTTGRGTSHLPSKKSQGRVASG
jgi:hypothetical protein